MKPYWHPAQEISCTRLLESQSQIRRFQQGCQ